MAPPPPPTRRLRDAVARENIAELVDLQRRGLIKSKEFSGHHDFGPEDVQVVLFDVYSLDSFAACCAARKALPHAEFEGVTRSGCGENLNVEVRDKVIALLGVCWDYDDMRNLIENGAQVLVLQSEDTLSEPDKNDLIQLGTWIEVDPRLGAGVLAWEFFNKGDPVPLLLRAIEDSYLGRNVFKDGKAMEDGIDVLLEDVTDINAEVKALLRPVAYRDEIFTKFNHLLNDNQATRKRLQVIAEKGRERAAEIAADQARAAASCVVRVFRHFPAWKCNMVLMSSKFEGRVAEFLAQQLADRCAGDEGRCFGAVLEIANGVRVVLRSLEGGPDVSQIAGHFGGCGSATRAFFKAGSSTFLESNLEQPEVVLRDVSLDSSCLTLKPKDLVTVMVRDQHFRDSPLDDWSWGFKVGEPEKEGWFPTLSYSVYIAVRTEPSHGTGVKPVKEGDIVVGHLQRGKYIYGRRLPGGPIETPKLKSWFPFAEDLFKRLHASSAAVALLDAGFFRMPEILA